MVYVLSGSEDGVYMVAGSYDKAYKEAISYASMDEDFVHPSFQDVKQQLKKYNYVLVGTNKSYVKIQRLTVC